MATKNAESIEITPINKESLTFCVLGTTPYMCNRMSEKAKRELLLPGGRKTAGDRAASLKHNPYQEYRSSPYIDRDPDAPTAITVMSTAFKGALRNAALDMPGSTKSQIGRLTYVVGDMVPLFGVPQMSMMITRSSDMNRTPDVRTRAIVPHWAAILTVEFVVPILKGAAVVNLLAAAGITQGVGDGRPEKGKMSYGQFELVNPDHAEFQAIVRASGRAAQLAALETPAFHDAETAELYEWFGLEAKRRGYKLSDAGFELSLAELAQASAGLGADDESEEETDE